MKLTLGAAFVYSLSLALGCSPSTGGGDPASLNNNNGNSTPNGGGGNTTVNNGGAGSFQVGTSGGTNGQTSDPKACAANSTNAELTRVNIIFLLDKSGSMGDDPKGQWTNAETRWNPVVTTLRAFFQDKKSTGLYAALSFLPADGNIGYACKTASYSSGNAIKVGLTLLDDTGRQSFLKRLCDPTQPLTSSCIVPAGGTPTRPALQGTIDYLMTQKNDSTTKTVIVFLTDGEPGFGFQYNGEVLGLNSCDDLPPLKSDNITPSCAVGSCGGCVDNYQPGSPSCTSGEAEVANVTNVIKSAPANSIYVFGVGDLTDETMNAWGSASGNKAVSLKNLSPSDAATTLRTALESIRSTHIDCKMAIPPPTDGSAINPALVNVKYVDGSGNELKLGKSADCTSSKPSWQYDDPGNPKNIIICPNTCEQVQQDPGGKLQVLFGCATQIL